MTGPGRAIAGALVDALRRVRRQSIGAIALAGAAVVPAALIAALLVGEWGVRGPGPLALVVGAALGAVGVVAWLARRWVPGLDEARIAKEAERARDLPEGSLRGVLELARSFPGGVSAALFHRTESELAHRLAGSSPAELSGELGRLTRRRWTRVLGVVAGLALLTAAAGFAAPDRARSAWSPLLRPVEHLRGPALPALAVAPGDTVVDRGSSAAVRVRAPMRAEATVHWRSVGEVPHQRTAAVVDGAATLTVGPVASPVRYWVTAPDGATTDTFRIDPRDPLLVAGLVVDLVYPEHTDRPAEHFEGSVPALRVPEGTRLRVRGQATGPLARAALRSEDGRSRPVPVDGTAFAVEWRLGPEATGRWAWVLTGQDAVPSEPPAPLDIAVTEDEPPQVRIVHPGVDTTFPGSLVQPVVADASDDYGLAGAALVFRVVDGQGERGEPRRVEIPVAEARRAPLRTVLDASGLALLPGDVVEYHVAVRDNGLRPRSTRSATYRLRLPGLAELRDRARQETAALLAEAERIARDSRSLESTTRDLSRKASAPPASNGSGGSPSSGSEEARRLAYEEAGEAGRVMARHEAMADRIEELLARLESVDRAAGDAGLTDPELQRRLHELRSLYEEMVTPEMRAQLDALREAVESLDREAAAAALERLAEDQDALTERLEESLAMMQRAAAEQELGALAREAEEISALQQALADALRQEAAGSEPTEPEAGEPEAGESGAGESEAGASEDAGTGLELPRPPESGASDPADSSEGSVPTPPRPGVPAPPELGPQESLERRAGTLQRALQALQDRLLQLSETDAASSTGAAREQGEASQRSMQESAGERRSGSEANAASSAQEAADQMAGAARTLDEARQQMAEAGQGAARAAVQQATQEALSLAQQQEALRREMEQLQGQGVAGGDALQRMRSEQAALQQGLEQLGRNLARTQERSAMLDRQVGQSLERARANMQQTQQGLEAGAMPVRSAERSVESLNQLAMSLLQNDGRLRQAGLSGGLQDALARLSELAREQGALNSQMGALAPMQLGDQAMTRQLARAAERQRGIARRIGQVSGMLGGREDVLGQLDPLSTEAESIARELDGSRLQPDVRARQERLFRRLLDAGRSLEREEYSDERVGGRPGRLDPLSPETLDPSILDDGIRYPPPTAAELRSLPPAYQRLILDYFDRLNRPEPGRSAGAGDEGTGEDGP